MNLFAWAACWLVVGFAMGVLAMVTWEQRANDRQAVRRAQRRALLGLPDRPPARSDSQGHARVSTANYVERRPDSTMQM